MKGRKVCASLVLLSLVMFLPMIAPAPGLTTNQVPSVVKQGFAARFPTVKRAEWKLKSDQNYEAEFTLKGTEIAAKFDSHGKWLETELAIGRSQVPKAVRNTVAKQFPGYKVVERQGVQRWNEERLAYELHLENATEIVKAQFSADGALVNQSAKAKSAKVK